MAIPKFNEIMYPLLNLISDGNEHTTTELIKDLGDYFSLTETEINQKMSNQNRSLFYDRFNWAKVYLRKALLLESTSRSSIQITNRGSDFLKQNSSSEITVKHLEIFPEFQTFRKGEVSVENDLEIVQSKQDELSPLEVIDNSYSQLINMLSIDIIEKIMSCSPKFFEELVVDVIVKIGYGGSIKEAGKVVGRTGDGGLDGVIKEDRLGLDLIYLQAKRWQDKVGRVEIQSFVGALAAKKAKKGIFITTSSFTQNALDYIKDIDHRIVLIDGKLLAELMIEYSIGVSSSKIFEIKTIDNDYFEES